MSGACLLIASLLTGAADATPADAELLARAESGFREGARQRDRPAEAKPLFRQAAEDYGALHRRGYDSAALARNEGNARLLADDLPRAILAYRRGLRLRPDDADLRAGLAYARSQVAHASPGDFGRPPVEHRPPWLPRLATGWYLVLVLLAYSVGLAALTRWWMVRRGRLLGVALGAFALAALFAAGLAAEAWRDGDLARRPVVVIADDGVLLRSGNGLAYPLRSETPLNRGVEARLLHVRGGWVQIELAGGEVGWVLREYTVFDEP